MKRYHVFAACLLLRLPTEGQKVYTYPQPDRDGTLNFYFEDTVADPYQWMENPDDPRLALWLAEQKKISRKEEKGHTKVWTLRAQIATMFSKTSEETADGYVSEKEEEKSKYIFKYYSSRLNRSPDLRYRKRGRTNFVTLISSKNFQRGKNDNAFITHYRVNEDETVLAAAISHGGSDWRNIYFFDLKTGRQLSDSLNFLRAGSEVIWHGNGVYYDRYNPPQKGRELLDKASGQALYYHKRGTSQSDDKLLYQNPDTTGTNPFGYAKMDSSRMIFYHSYYPKGEIYKALSYADISNADSFFLRNFLLYPNDAAIRFSVEELFGDTAIVTTTWNSPNGKVLKTNINEKNKLLEIIPEFDVPLREVNQLGKDKLACIYRDKGKFLVLIYDLGGQLLKTIDFPEGKKVRFFYEQDPDAEYTNFCVSSFYHPDLWYQLSLDDFSFKPAATVWIPYKAEDLETRYVTCKSKDGTMVPMYITCLKDTRLDGNNPTLLYGYGGYGITVEPNYQQTEALWLLHGGILAIPNVRGGGAEGDDWGKEGRKLKKQNAIDDFVAAAEYLIEANYTNPEKLAVNGGSHGGLLVGAAITQRPELFKVAIIEAGALDMLRFENFTVGSMNTNLNEFGSISNFEDYKNLKSYSPLHNIQKDVVYPNVLVISGDLDDRVPPHHSYKFLATLQRLGSPESLYQLYVVSGAGHGGALTNDDWVDKLLFKYYFLFDQLKLKFW